MKKILIIVSMLLFTPFIFADVNELTEFEEHVKKLEIKVDELKRKNKIPAKVAVALKERYKKLMRSVTEFELMIMEENEDIIKTIVFIKNVLKEATEQDLQKEIALTFKRQYDAFIEAGFTKKEAMTLLSSVDIPTDMKLK